jgi:6-pyruvoyltetrahydropterin/6-carboxytetrahydropterin synthase
MSYGVRVDRNRLRFMAAHMATWSGGCEPLHGHNYQVTAEVEGNLTEDSWVIDFSVLKRAVRELCEAIDHKFLLQRESRVLQIAEQADGWEIRIPDGRRYQLPASDVVPLPIENTTAERLAEWFHAGIAAALLKGGAANIARLRVEVEEAPGQSGWYSAPIEQADQRSGL